MNLSYKIETGSSFSEDINEFISSQGYSHLWQSKFWYIFREEQSRKFEFIIARNESGKVVGVAQYLHLVFFRKLKYTYVSGGPEWDRKTPEVFRLLLQRIYQDAKENGSVFVHIDPTVESFSKEEVEILQEFNSQDATYSIRPNGTALVDVRAGYDDTFKKFKKNTRYSIRVAKKNGVSVVKGKSKSDFAKYNEIVKKTEARQGFTQRDSEFFLQLLETSHFEHPVFLLIAEHENTPIAGGIFVAFQKRLHYLAGGFDYDKRDLQGASLLQEAAMNLAIEANCDYYDFFSYSFGEEESFITVDKFKEGFNPILKQWEKPQDLVINRAVYSLYRIVHKVKT